MTTINKDIKAYMDILSNDTNNLKQSTIEELKQLIISGLSNESEPIETVKQVASIKEKNKTIESTKKHYSVQEIQWSCCRVLNISYEKLMSKSRKSRIVYCRHMAMYIVRDTTNLSYPDIAKLFNREDHTTVMHAYDKIKDSLKEHVYTRIKYNEIMKDLKEFYT